MKKFFDNLGSALGGIFFGVILFFASIYVVFQNEGSTNFREVADTALPISEQSAPEDLIFATDLVTTPERISDNMYLKQGNYLKVQRNVEMFSWDENKKTTTDEDGDDKVTYSYKQTWTASPKNSAEFAIQEGHYNPDPWISESTELVSKASIGDYELDMKKVKLPGGSPLSLAENVLDTASGEVMEEFIFVGSGSIQSPSIGDMRISYDVLQAGDTYTVFGKHTGSEILAHHGKHEKEIYRLFEGDVDDAKAVLQGEYEFNLWLWRILGFVGLWAGLILVLKPIMVILDVVPVLGKFVNSGITFVTFLIALIITVVTSLISIVLHNIFGLIIVALATGAASYFLFFKKNPHSRPTGTTTNKA